MDIQHFTQLANDLRRAGHDDAAVLVRALFYSEAVQGCGDNCAALIRDLRTIAEFMDDGALADTLNDHLDSLLATA